MNLKKLFNVVKRDGLFQAAAQKSALFRVTRSSTALFTPSNQKEAWF